MIWVELQGSGDEELVDSAVAGESVFGERGKETGDSGSESRPLVQVFCDMEEKGPVREVGHDEEGGSEWASSSILVEKPPL